jgi:FAD/FMN-containing dehydrogenase
MPTRRKALGAVAQAAAGLALLPFAPRRAGSSVLVNDIHSELNPTRVDRIVAIESEATLQAALAAARVEGKPVCVAGGRHAMGGQQFAEDAVLLDVRPMRRIIGLNAEHGVVEAEAGIQWPELIERLIGMQRGQRAAWGIIQKQTGADRLTLGGALGANIHGRGLALKPIIGDVESFTLMQADGSLSICSRNENPELFRLAIGGYGLFGVVTRVRLRLRRRTKLERVVRIIDIEDLMPAFAERIGEGYIYGDCQFSTDASSDTICATGCSPAIARCPPTRRCLRTRKNSARRNGASSTITRMPTHGALTTLIPRTTCRPRDSATGPT